MDQIQKHYKVYFSVKYGVKFGQSISIIGDQEQLGQWKTPKVNLSWSKGNIWILNDPVKFDTPKFCFKYVVVEGGNVVRWEEGDDRKIDLETALVGESKKPQYFKLDNEWADVKSCQKQIKVEFEPIDEQAQKRQDLLSDIDAQAKSLLQSSIKKNFEDQKVEEVKETKENQSPPSSSKKKNYVTSPWENDDLDVSGQSDAEQVQSSGKREIDNTTCTSSVLEDESNYTLRVHKQLADTQNENTSEIDDLTNFDKYFPKLIGALDKFEELIDFKKFRDQDDALKDKSFMNRVKIRQAFYREEDQNILPIFREELSSILPNDYWNTLYSQSQREVKGVISIHTINVMYTTLRDPFYLEQYTEYEKNVHKWASLLHDICKRGEPEIIARDHIHPFISAEAVLIIFKHLGIIKIEGKDQVKAFDELLELIRDSKQPYHEKYLLKQRDNELTANCTEMHSHHNLQKIFKLLWGDSPINHITPRGSFTDHVFRIVLFHQSLFGVPMFKPVTPLNQTHQYLYIDPIVYKLMVVMMICDSKSYTFLLDHKFTAEAREGFTIYVELQRQQWVKKFKELKQKPIEQMSAQDKSLVSNLRELKFYDLEDEQLYSEEELVLEVTEKQIEGERDNYEKMMISLELNEFEDLFGTNQCVWIGGQLPSYQDNEAYKRFTGLEISPELHPYMFAWFQLVSMFTDKVRQSWK